MEDIIRTTLQLPMKHPLVLHSAVYWSDPVAHYSCSSFYLHYWLIRYGKAFASMLECNCDTCCFLYPLTSGFLSPQMELSALQSMMAVQEGELQVQAADMESLTRTIQIKEDLIKVFESFFKDYWKRLQLRIPVGHLQTTLGYIESSYALLVWASWYCHILSGLCQSC